ncbi:hypothetical protein ACFS4T_16100 [Pseudomonas lini]
MPALYNLSRDGLLGNGLRIIGVDHNAISDEAFAKKTRRFHSGGSGGQGRQGRSRP